jgi:hypothetical protein
VPAATSTGDLGLSPTMPNSVELTHLFDMHVELAPAQSIASPEATRMIFVAEGGRFEGERISGVVLPGGGDWLRIGTDLVGRLDVRATLRTDDDQLIYMTNSGVVALGQEGLERFAAGDDVAWDQAHIRSAPLFETGAEDYSWINSVTTVAINELGPGYVNYRILEVL